MSKYSFFPFLFKRLPSSQNINFSKTSVDEFSRLMKEVKGLHPNTQKALKSRAGVALFNNKADLNRTRKSIAQHQHVVEMQRAVGAGDVAKHQTTVEGLKLEAEKQFGLIAFFRSFLRRFS